MSRPTPGGGRIRRLTLLAIAGALAATALLAVAILLFGDFGETEWRTLATTGLVAGYGVLALPAAILGDRGRHRWLAAALVTLAGAGLALALIALWTASDAAWLMRALVAVTAFAVAAAQTAALAARRSLRDPSLVRLLFAASVVLSLALAALLTYAVLFDAGGPAFGRIFAALAVIDLLTVTLQPILGASGAVQATFAVRIVTDAGTATDATLLARDFAAAAERAVRRAEAGGARVVRVERLADPPPGGVVGTR